MTPHHLAMKHSTRDGDCWIWHGATTGNTPMVHRNGTSRSLRKLLLPHPQPAGSHAAVTCNQPLCVNPDHLTWRTPTLEERRRNAPLTILDLHTLHQRHLNGETVTSLAHETGISRQNLHRQWKKWVHSPPTTD
jgi:hypothetical protein